MQVIESQDFPLHILEPLSSVYIRIYILFCILKVFDLLRETSPASLEKLQIIPGEITQPFLGISEENQAILAEKVSVAFHVAAAVRFDNPLA